MSEAGVESDNHLFHEGDILYSKVRPALNKVTIATFDGMCSADMYPIQTSFNHCWLKYYMLSDTFMKQVIVSTDRVKMPKLNKEELGRFKVVLPGNNEQRAIATYLDERTAESTRLSPTTNPWQRSCASIESRSYPRRLPASSKYRAWRDDSRPSSSMAPNVSNSQGAFGAVCIAVGT